MFGICAKKTKIISLPLAGLMVGLILFPCLGYADLAQLDGAFDNAKTQIETILTSRKVFWLIMLMILSSGVVSLVKGSWKGVALTIIIGAILSNFSALINLLLSINLFN